MKLERQPPFAHGAGTVTLATKNPLDPTGRVTVVPSGRVNCTERAAGSATRPATTRGKPWSDTEPPPATPAMKGAEAMACGTQVPPSSVVAGFQGEVTSRQYVPSWLVLA